MQGYVYTLPHSSESIYSGNLNRFGPDSSVLNNRVSLFQGLLSTQMLHREIVVSLSKGILIETVYML